MATGDKFMKEISDQFLICKICFEPFRDPKTLVCLHTFCCQCLQQHQDAENSRPSRYAIFSRYVSCPLCRRKTEVPTGGIRRLQDNFLVSNLTEIVNRKYGGLRKAACEICHTVRPRSNLACSRCLDCSKLLCKACVELHQKTKVTMKHSLIDLEGEKDIECKAHPEETVRFYCQPCDACICVVCTFQEHHGHDVASFSEGSLKYKAELEELVSQCRERQTSVDNRLKLIDKYENLLKNVRDRIRDLAISYIAQVRATERDLMRKVDEIFGADVVEFMQQKTWLQENFDSLQSSCSLTEIILKDKGVEMLLLKKELQTKLSQLLESSLPSIPEGLPDRVNFVPGTVKLGYIAVSTEAQNGEDLIKPVSDIEDEPPEKLSKDEKALDWSVGDEKPCNRCQETQTDHHELVDGTSSMSCDVTTVEVQSSSQTEEVRMSNRETNTDRILTLERGTVAYSADSKNKGTMTERKSFRSLKSQTPRTVTYDQETSTCASVASADVAIMTSLGLPHPPMISKAQQATPRTATKGDWLTNTLPRSSMEVALGTDISLGGCDLQADSTTVEWLQRLSGARESQMTSSTAALTASQPGEASMQSSTSSSSSSSPTFNRFAYRPKKLAETVANQIDLPPGVPAVTPTSPYTSPVLGARSFSRPRVEQTYKVDQGSMTQFKVRIVPEMTEKETSPEKRAMVDGATMTSRDAVAMSTQTPIKRLNSVAMGTDYSGQSDKGTFTPAPQIAEAGTSMPLVTFDSKVTWTERVLTTERAVNACAETSDTGSGSSSVSTGDCSVQVRPGIRVCATNTPRVRVVSHETQTPCDISSDATKPYSGEGPAPLPHGPATYPVSGGNSLPRRRKSCIEVSEKNVGTEAVGMATIATDTEGVIVLSHTATETTPTSVANQATATSQVHMTDQWTLTPAPQLINTGVSPHCPATMDTGVSTPAVVTMEQATYTEVVTVRETGTEVAVEMADGETLTERLVLHDAQTGHDVTTEDNQTCTDPILTSDTAAMTDPDMQKGSAPATDNKAVQIRPAQSSRPTNTPHPASRGAESQTDFSSIDCAVCEHQVAAWEELAAKQFTDSCTEPHPPATCDVGTMALSVLTSAETSAVHTQTSSPKLLDKLINTSMDFEDENEASLREYRDAATSTESLPYIGLLSEIDVDELIVVPEAAFDLVSDSDSEVETAEAETLTDTLQYVESGVQTMLTFTPPDFDTDPRVEGRADRHVVSVGVNTVSKMTFEKETCTPSRHLFSKGTMTFYVAKMDKSTSTPGQSRVPPSPDVRNARPSKEPTSSKCPVVDKVTMTPTPELRDIAIETDPRLMDGRLTECISKLRSVSERLNSPTQRQGGEGEAFFGKTFPPRGSDSSDRSLQSSISMETSSERPLSPSSFRGEDVEAERRRQLQKLLDETHAILKAKDVKTEGAVAPGVGVRKAQPITTLRGRGPDRNQECWPGYQTRSLPRQFSADPPSPVKLGSQSAAPCGSRLPLLRYNSAPGRIATVPAQKLMNSGGPRPPAPKQPSPSRIPVSQKPGDASPPPPPHNVSVDQFPPATKASKSPQKPSLPSITETRTPSSCSDTSTASYLSAQSGDTTSLAPSLELRSPSPTPSANTTSSEVTDSTLEKSSGEATTSTETVGEKSSSKKGGLGFMQRLLSKKRKGDPEQKAQSGSSSPQTKPIPKVPAPKPSPPSPPKPDIPRKPKGFVYVRQRIFSIQHDNEDEREFMENEKQRLDGEGPESCEGGGGDRVSREEQAGANCAPEPMVEEAAAAVKPPEVAVKEDKKTSKEKAKGKEVKEKSKSVKEKDKAREKKEREMEKARAKEREKREKREKEEERKAKAMKKKTEKVPLSPVCNHGKRKPGAKGEQPSTSTANGATAAKSPPPSRK